MMQENLIILGLLFVLLFNEGMQEAGERARLTPLSERDREFLDKCGIAF